MKNQIIQELKRLATELKRNPKRDEFVKLNIHSISKRQLLKYFETYTDALVAANLPLTTDRREQGTIQTICKQCSISITKNKSELKKSENTFCSKSCAATHNNSLKPKQEKSVYIKVPKTCISCNTTYSKDGRDATNTCSRLCFVELGMKQRIMKDVIKRAGANTYDTIRQNARAYSKYFYPSKCMLCDYTKHYEVCHVKDLKDFTREETLYEINNKTNLIHLCPNCHWEFDNNQLDILQIQKAQEKFLAGCIQP